MTDLFDLTDRVILVTGATGTLTGSVADYLASQGARIVYLGRNQQKLDAALANCRSITPTAQCLGLVADVLDRPALERARDVILDKWGRIDGLLNGAGGNMPASFWVTKTGGSSPTKTARSRREDPSLPKTRHLAASASLTNCMAAFTISSPMPPSS